MAVLSRESEFRASDFNGDWGPVALFAPFPVCLARPLPLFRRTVRCCCPPWALL